MTKEQRVPAYTRLSKKTLDLINDFARAKHMTRAAAIRRLIEERLEEISIVGGWK